MSRLRSSQLGVNWLTAGFKAAFPGPLLSTHGCSAAGRAGNADTSNRTASNKIYSDRPDQPVLTPGVGL